MTPQQKRDLTDLRAAAQGRNQEQLQYMLKRLLGSMDYYVALTVPLERIWQWLDIFESYYPDEDWLRKLVLAINSYGIRPDDTVAEMALQQNFSEPGAANYIKAVYDLTQSMQDKHTGEARISYMTSSVVNCIMAELAEAWYGERTDDWRRVRANQFDPATGTYSDPDAAQIAYEFWTNVETAALDTTSWLEIANAIEKKLTRFEEPSS